MTKRPIGDFLIGLTLLILAFKGARFFRLFLPSTAINWLCLVCFLLSFVFALLAVIKGVKEIKIKENSFVFNLIAILGSTLILIISIFWTILLLTLIIGGFPNRS
jgi:hypothetical protein